MTNASPTILLAKAGRLDLLRNLFGGIQIPEPVHGEAVLKAPEARDANSIRNAIEDGWMQVTAVDPNHLTRIIERYPNLGLGEASTIAAALEQGHHHLLMDDHDGRQAAKLEGLRPIGCLGILARARHTGHLGKHEFKPALEELLDAGLWVSPNLVTRFLAQVDDTQRR